MLNSERHRTRRLDFLGGNRLQQLENCAHRGGERCGGQVDSSAGNDRDTGWDASKLGKRRVSVQSIFLETKRMLLSSSIAEWSQKHSWPIRLPTMFAENGLENIAVDNRPFPPELLPFQLDTALMASEEVSYQALDPIDNGSGERCRNLISDVFQHRQQLAYNVGRLTVVGQRPV